MSCHNKCCICIPLRNRILILGYILMVLKSVHMYFSFKDLREVWMKLLDFGFSASAKFGVRISVLLACLVMILFFVEFIMTIRLLVGVHEMNRYYIKRFCKVYLILFSIYFVSFAIILVINLKSYRSTDWLFKLIYLGIWVFELYTVYIARWFATEMKTKPTEGVTYNVASTQPATAIEALKYSNV